MATGDTILVSQHNPFAADVQQALGNSLDRNGTGGMRAPLLMGGNAIKNVAPGTNPTDVATVAQVAGGGAPVGAMIDYAGATAPAGWMLCGGQSLNRSDFPELFAVIGTTYGSVSGTTFNVPDMRGRVSAGADFGTGGVSGRLSSVGSSVGSSGGSQAVVLTVDQMPSHGHTLSGSTSVAGAHTHMVDGATGGPAQFGGGGGTREQIVETSSNGDHSHTLAGSAANTGGGLGHSNVQPTLVLNKIIRTGVN